MRWRKDRQDAWDLWLHDFLYESVKEKMLGHAGHEGPVDLPNKEVFHALVDVGIVLGYTDWTTDEFGAPTLSNITTLIDAIADGIVTTYTNEMEQA